MQSQNINPATYEQEVAVSRSDEEIIGYYLPIYKYGIYSKKDRGKVTNDLCDDIEAPVDPRRPINIRPAWIPFTRSGVRDCIDVGLSPLRGRFSIIWNQKNSEYRDTVYEDGFRAVFVFKGIEFMIRPLKEGDGPKRLYIGSVDIMNCLSMALGINPQEEMTMVIGTASAADHHVNPKAAPIKFEWRVDRADVNKVSREVAKWRNSRFRDAGEYQQAKDAYDFQQRLMGLDQSRQFAGGPASAPPGPMPPLGSTPGQGPVRPPKPPPSRRDKGSGSSSKRKKESKSRRDSPEPERSYKRRSGDNQGMPPAPRSVSSAPTTQAITQGVSNLTVTARGEMPPSLPQAYGEGGKSSTPNMIYGGLGIGYRPSFNAAAPAHPPAPAQGPPQARAFYPAQGSSSSSSHGPGSYSQGGSYDYSAQQYQQQQYPPQGPQQDFGPFVAEPEDFRTDEEVQEMIKKSKFDDKIWDKAMKDAIAEENKQRGKASGQPPYQDYQGGGSSDSHGRHHGSSRQGPSQYKKGHDKHRRRDDQH